MKRRYDSLLKVASVVTVVAGMLLGLSEAAIANTERTYPTLWNSKEIKRDSLKRFKLWTKALDRIELEEPRPGDICPDPMMSPFQQCHWYEYVKTLKDRTREDQIRVVNLKANQRRYVQDPVNWQVPDYWESPGQFLQKQGDCEDYAIVKYMALRKLGFSAEEMRIVVVRDLNLGVAHAVLALYQGDEIIILDNQVKKPVAADRISHYRVVYSLNENHWWEHKQ